MSLHSKHSIRGPGHRKEHVNLLGAGRNPCFPAYRVQADASSDSDSRAGKDWQGIAGEGWQALLGRAGRALLGRAGRAGRVRGTCVYHGGLAGGRRSLVLALLRYTAGAHGRTSLLPSAAPHASPFRQPATNSSSVPCTAQEQGGLHTTCALIQEAGPLQALLHPGYDASTGSMTAGSWLLAHRGCPLVSLKQRSLDRGAELAYHGDASLWLVTGVPSVGGRSLLAPQMGLSRQYTAACWCLQAPRPAVSEPGGVPAVCWALQSAGCGPQAWLTAAEQSAQFWSEEHGKR